MDVTFHETEPFDPLKNAGNGSKGESSNNIYGSGSSVLVPIMDTIPLDNGTEGEPNHDAEANIHEVFDDTPSQQINTDRVILSSDSIVSCDEPLHQEVTDNDGAGDQIPPKEMGHSEDTGTSHSTNPSNVGSHPVVPRKSTRKREIPARLKDCVEYQHDIAKFVSYERCSPSFKSFICSLDSKSAPTDWREAIMDPKWKAAMLEEMEALEKNNTWEVVELPKGKEPVGCKWVYTIKQNPDGKVDRYKARLVAKGYTQTYGVDYEQTFAPVAKINTIRTLISCAVNLDWHLHQLDVKNAFLHGDLHEEVYMHIPPGFATAKTEGKVLKLHRSLYGLKQSPRAWFDRFRKAVLKLSYKQSNADHTLFYKKKGNMLTILIVYVDDIVITGNDIAGIEELKQQLKREFEVKDLGQL
jgi:hypothetical protein